MDQHMVHLKPETKSLTPHPMVGDCLVGLGGYRGRVGPRGGVAPRFGWILGGVGMIRVPNSCCDGGIGRVLGLGRTSGEFWGSREISGAAGGSREDRGVARGARKRVGVVPEGSGGYRSGAVDLGEGSGWCRGGVGGCRGVKTGLQQSETSEPTEYKQSGNRVVTGWYQGGIKVVSRWNQENVG